MARLRQIIFTVGPQRSGTTALTDSFAQTYPKKVFNESPDSIVFKDKKLLRQKELMELTFPSPTIVAKANMLFDMFSVEQILERYNRLDVKIVWMCRHPADVYASHYELTTGNSSSQHPIELNRKLLHNWLDKHNEMTPHSKTTELCHFLNFDLCTQPEFDWTPLSKFLKLKNAPTMEPRTGKGHELPKSIREEILALTIPTWDKLKDICEQHNLHS